MGTGVKGRPTLGLAGLVGLAQGLTRASFPALPEALAGADLGRAAAELDTLLRKYGATSRAQPAELVTALSFARGKLPNAKAASFALEGGSVARSVVSHVRVVPFFAGLSICVHPRPEVEAPLLVADVSITPSGNARAYFDTAGPGHGTASFRTLRDQLLDVMAEVRCHHRRPVPSWIAPHSGGAGARMHAHRGQGENLVRGLVRYAERYLIGLSHAPPAKDAHANAEAARAVGEAVRRNGPAGRYLERAFGPDFAARYLGLLWCEDLRAPTAVAT
jgi:hypothetical protein